MIDFVEETPPLRRQRVEHFRRKIGFVVPDIDVIITEKERHARIVLLPWTRGVAPPLGKNQQRAGRTAITFPDLRNPLVEEMAFLAIIRLVCAGDKRRPALVLLHLVQFPEHPRHARVYLSVVILVTVIGVNRLTAGVRTPPLVPVIAVEIAQKTSFRRAISPSRRQ